MELQIVIWLGMNIVLLILCHPKFKKDVVDDGFPTKYSTLKEKSFSQIFGEVYLLFIIAIIIGMVSFAIFFCLVNIESAAKFCKECWLVSILPILITYIKPKSNKVFLICLIIYSCIISLASYYPIEFIEQNRVIFSAGFAILISLTMITIIQSFISQKSIRIKKPKDGVWKDLFFRKPYIALDYKDELEISRCLEKLYNLYLHSLHRINDVKRIEYVTLRDVWMSIWYKKASFAVKFLIYSLLCVNLYLYFCFENIKFCIVLVELLFFLLIVLRLKRKDYPYLKLLGIRYFFDDWGYCIYAKKNKYVGYMQAFAISKYHKFIHNYLNIMAITRFAYELDKIKGTSLIKYMSSDMIEIAENILKKEKNWIDLLPIWMISFLEYRSSNELPYKNKEILAGSIREKKDKINLAIFLQSTYSDFTRKLPDPNAIQEVKLFIDYIYCGGTK